MVQKRPFTGESYEVPSKHQRQFEHSGHLVSFLEFPSEDMDSKPHTPGKDGFTFTRSTSEHEVEPESCETTELPKGDTDNFSPGGISNSSWASTCTSEDDVRFEATFHSSASPKYYDYDLLRRTPVHHEDTYLERPPKKLVPIGPDFQADLPEWSSNFAKDAFVLSDSAEVSTLCPQASGTNLGDYFNTENKFLGSCVVPMPQGEPSACSFDRVGNCRILCCHVDPGSVRCVRLHIVEARENLERAVGHESFVKLGFSDMGEVVAEKWSEEDQQLFQDVVFSNPSSAAKNFWDHLSAVFHSRTKKEIVSYYFNVFMLRKRAEQNRCDAMNIDSDDDEWQEIDDETEISEEDEDSVVELPVCEAVPGWSKIRDDFSREFVNSPSNHYDMDFVKGSKGISKVAETCPGKLINNLYVNNYSPFEKIFLDVNDHLRISNDTIKAEPETSQLKVDNRKGFSTGLFNGSSHEFFLEPCDDEAQVWDDVGYLSCPRNDSEFLPTHSMIEEVFGDGSWDN